MFPESAVSKNFSCGERKCAYLVLFDMAPHFKSLLLRMVNEQDDILNRSMQTKQMDIAICAWQPEAREVESGCYGPVFAVHATAVDMLEHFSAMKACL